MAGPRGLESSMWSSTRCRVPHLRASASTTSLRSVSSEPAPPVPPPTPKPTRYSSTTPANRLTPAKAFHRFEQACQRIRWKSMDLKMSYQRANNPDECDFLPADAERNFKVDFHEFYVWIEQALVLLLLFFGITVPRGGAAYNGPQSSSNHAYHHNVLQALREDGCPVHAALGQGDVMHALMTAKTLRNRWKGAAAEEGETPPLRMYDVSWILDTIWGGLAKGYDIAAEKVRRDELQRRDMERQQRADAPERPMTPMQQVNGRGRTDDEWEWMVEPMDWEAA